MPYFSYLDLVIIVVLLAWLAKLWWHIHRRQVKSWWKRTKDRLPRHWKPKSPDDCPHCQAGIHLHRPSRAETIVPWSNRKSRRGAKKRITTDGLACLNPACAYFGIRDATIHALVGNGKRGKDRDIQYFKCQCCQKAFTSRKGTPLYYLKSKTDQVELVLWFLAEGVDLSVMVRYTGKADATLARWLDRMGAHSAGFHDIFFRGLVLSLVQLDELHARVRDEQKARWLWLVIDPVSKALPALHLGGRKAEDAYAVVHDLKDCLHPDCVPAMTTDGLRSYFYAITAHFGHWFRPPRARKDQWQVDDNLHYGQLIKRKERRKLTFTITRMVWGKRSILKAILQEHGFPNNIQTAFIERVNLTIRQGVSLLTRRTWSLAKSEQHLTLHIQWWRLYYHFARTHESLQEPVPGLKRRYRSRSPAMALGLTDHLWSVTELLTYPLVPWESAV